MNEAVVFLVEKEAYEELLHRYHSQPSLSFRQVGKDRYRVYNETTGRFHNLDLGIDEVI